MKELSKAINIYIAAPTLPLPDDLVETIAAYLRRHPKYDEAAADRLQEELFSIFNKHVKGNLAASAPWIAILRGLLPMIQTSERLVLWLDSLDGILSRTSHDKGIVDQTVAGLMDIVAIADEYQEDTDGEVKLNPIMENIFGKWMNKFYPGLVAGVQGMEYNERMFRDCLVQFGKKRPLVCHLMAPNQQSHGLLSVANRSIAILRITRWLLCPSHISQSRVALSV